MKKLLSLALLLLALTACGTKDSVEKATTETPTESSDEMVFVKKLDSTQASISRALSQNEANTILQGKYNEVSSLITEKTGRNVPSDSYFVFDKNGNILELGVKEEAVSEVYLWKFNPMPNNVPVLMEPDFPRYCTSQKLVNSEQYAFMDNDIFNFGGINYITGLWETSTETRIPDKYDIQGRLSEVSVDEVGYFSIFDEYSVYPTILDLSNNPIDIPTFFNTNKNVRLKYDYDTKIGTLYSNNVKIGTTKDLLIEYTFTNNKISKFTIDAESTAGNEFEATFNTVGKLLTAKSGVEIRENKYDENKPYLLVESSMYGANPKTLTESQNIVYTFTPDEKIASFKITYSSPGKEDWDISLIYNRDSYGNIFEVITDLNFLNGVRLKGTFIPKQ